MDFHKTTTIGFDDSFQGFQLSDGSIVNVRILDTCGQEKFKALNEYYYKDADCCLLVYAIDDEASFERIKNYYIGKLKEYNKKIIKVMLIGNKTDLDKDKEREVSIEEGTNLAEKHGFIFKETSCVDNYNVADAFATIIEMTNSEMYRTERVSTRFKLTDKNKKNQKKNKRC